MCKVTFKQSSLKTNLCQGTAEDLISTVASDNVVYMSFNGPFRPPWRDAVMIGSSAKRILTYPKLPLLAIRRSEYQPFTAIVITGAEIACEI